MGKWDHRKAEALAALTANGGNVNRTAQQLGIPESTLRGWKRQDERDRLEEADPTTPEPVREQLRDSREFRERKKEALADQLEDLARKIVEVLPDKLQSASMKDAATALGIAVDKMQLLRKEPTQITENRENLSPDERARRIAEILDRGRDRRGVAVSDAGGTGGDRGAHGAVH